MKRFLVLFLTVMCLYSFAGAQEPASIGDWLEGDFRETLTQLFDSETTFTTVGTAKVNADMDVAVLSFALKEKGETVDEANAKISNAFHMLKQTIIAQGIDENSIRRMAYDVAPDVVYYNTKLTDTEIIHGYLVNMEISVRMTDLSLIGKVIEAAVHSGAGGTHELRYESSQLESAYQTALNEAMQQAMEKAEGLAQACGKEFSDLISVAELSAMSDEYAVIEITCCAQ